MHGKPDSPKQSEAFVKKLTRERNKDRLHMICTALNMADVGGKEKKITHILEALTSGSMIETTAG